MIHVSFQNIGGELDGKDVRTAKEAAEAAAAMIESAGELYPGDKIVLTGEEE